MFTKHKINLLKLVIGLLCHAQFAVNCHCFFIISINVKSYAFNLGL